MGMKGRKERKSKLKRQSSIANLQRAQAAKAEAKANGTQTLVLVRESQIKVYTVTEGVSKQLKNVLVIKDSD